MKAAVLTELNKDLEIRDDVSLVDLDDSGFIKCDPLYLRTNVPGVFVAGDCRTGAAMQLATAVGDGVAAALFIKEYLRDPAWWNQDRITDTLSFA